MRRQTGEALLSMSPGLRRPAGPAQTSLVGRLAELRGLPVVTGQVRRTGTPGPLTVPTAGLVTAPPAGRMLATGGPPFAGFGLLGAHGGAGVSSLLRAGLDQLAVDAGRCWPRAGLVLLVARTSTNGLEWARDLARQHASGLAGAHVELLGLVLVADAPGRLPARITELWDLIGGAFCRTWQLRWLEEWRMAAADEPLPRHPDIAQLTAELARTPHRRPPHLSVASPTPRIPGDLP